MEHKHTQSQIDAVINKWRGKHAGEKMIAEYDGNKWSKYQRYRMDGGFIFHIATDTLKLTITPPDAKLEAKRTAKADTKLAKGVKANARCALNLQSLDPDLPNDRRPQIVTELCEASARFELFWL